MSPLTAGLGLLELALLAVCAAGAADGQEIDPRLLLTTDEIAREDGYLSESHLAKTSDGYLLTLHRVRSPTATRKGPPVLMLHGLFVASDSWVLTGPGRAPAYVLADAGYDVWLGNFRGNFYSKRHVSMSPSEPAFWKFSFQDMGEQDIPAMLDVVLATTGWRRAVVICHSMGCTALLCMLGSPVSRRHSTSIRYAALLSPAVIPKENIFNSGLTPNIMKYLDSHGPYEIFPRSKSMVTFIAKLCDSRSRLIDVCKAVFSASTQKEPSDLDSSALAFDIAHLVSGASLYSLLHFSQLIKSKQFRMYDHGEEGNMKRYGQMEPPPFELGKITVPISIHYADGKDVVLDKKEAERLYNIFPVHIGLFGVPDKRFTHIDFIYSNNTKEMVFDNIMNIINKL